MVDFSVMQPALRPAQHRNLDAVSHAANGRIKKCLLTICRPAHVSLHVCCRFEGGAHAASLSDGAFCTRIAFADARANSECQRCAVSSPLGEPGSISSLTIGPNPLPPTLARQCIAPTRSHQGFAVNGISKKTRMLAAITGSPDTQYKPLRERMPAAGCEPANIGYNEMPALTGFPGPGVQTMRSTRHEKN